MTSRRPYALIDIHWLPLPVALKYPATRDFGSTGYREADGPEGLFSVYVKMLDGDPGAAKVQSAKLYALADAMRDRLPEIGAKFFLSTGRAVVAECTSRDRGDEEAEL